MLTKEEFQKKLLKEKEDRIIERCDRLNRVQEGHLLRGETVECSISFGRMREYEESTSCENELN